MEGDSKIQGHVGICGGCLGLRIRDLDWEYGLAFWGSGLRDREIPSVGQKKVHHLGSPHIGIGLNSL